MYNYIKYKLLLSCLFVVLNISLNAQNTDNSVILNFKIDTSQMLIGDHKNVELSIETNENIKINWPNINNWSSKITIVEPSMPDTIIDNNNVIYKHNFKITSFDTGFIALPPISFIYADSNKIDTIETEPKLIYVSPIELDSTDSFKDIKAIKTEKYTLKEFMPYILIGLAAIILIFIIIYVVDRIRKNKPIIPQKIKKSIAPHIEAYQSLQNLDRKKLWQSGEIKSYYTELTNILKVYISRRYETHTLEKTSSEILIELDKLEIEHSTISKIKDLLETSDFVKFAKLTPANEKFSIHFKVVENFIDITKQIETEQENTKY